MPKRNSMKLLLLSLFILSSTAQAITLKEWKKLTIEQKSDYLTGESGDFYVDIDSKKIISTSLDKPRAARLNTPVISTIKKLVSFKTVLTTEVEDDFYALVGSVKRTADLFFSSDNHFLGAYISYRQAGCSHSDQSGGHYATTAEALKNNCVDNDVSWTGTSAVDENIIEVYESGYMDWTGH